MLSTILNGFRYTASFLISLFSTDSWTKLIIGCIGALALAVLVSGFIFNAAAASSSILIAAGVLSVFMIPLSLGIFYLDKNKPSSEPNKEDMINPDSNDYTLPFLATQMPPFGF